jgi:hypothetical protein
VLQVWKGYNSSSCAEMLLDSLEHGILGRVCAGWVSCWRSHQGPGTD